MRDGTSRVFGVMVVRIASGSRMPSAFALTLVRAMVPASDIEHKQHLPASRGDGRAGTIALTRVSANRRAFSIPMRFARPSRRRRGSWPSRMPAIARLDSARRGDRRICREREVTFLVDAAQTVGVLPIDIQAMNIDLLAFPGPRGSSARPVPGRSTLPRG